MSWRWTGTCSRPPRPCTSRAERKERRGIRLSSLSVLCAKKGVCACLLHWNWFPAIINTKNKNAAVCGRANARKPAQVLTPPTQRPSGRTAWILYDIPVFLVKVGFAVVLLRPCCMEKPVLLALCRLALHGVFVFRPPPGGGSPRGRCGEEHKWRSIEHGRRDTETDAKA